MFGIALFEPEIPQNTGTLMRFCACTGLSLHIIMPCGFLLDEKRIKRSGMMYIKHADVTVYKSFNEFCDLNSSRRIIGVTPRHGVPFLDFTFTDQDIILMGKESTGIPENIYGSINNFVNIPMKSGMDSMNLALASVIVASEGMRQLNLFKRLI